MWLRAERICCWNCLLQAFENSLSSYSHRKYLVAGILGCAGFHEYPIFIKPVHSGLWMRAVDKKSNFCEFFLSVEWTWLLHLTLHCDSCKVQKPYATEIDKHKDEIPPLHLIFSITDPFFSLGFFCFSLVIVFLLCTCV